jgi:hypothetical protein
MIMYAYAEIPRKIPGSIIMKKNPSMSPTDRRGVLKIKANPKGSINPPKVNVNNNISRYFLPTREPQAGQM